SYGNEPFRVYSRRSGGGGYDLVATVTSCSDGICTYLDTNVVQGRSYDYYIATVDERDNQELGTSQAVQVNVATSQLTAPGAPAATGIDGAAFLQWEPTGAERYMIVMESEGGDAFLIG